MTRRLEVLLHGAGTGEISELPEGGSELRFLAAYLDRVPRPVLGQRFEDDLYARFRSRRGQTLPDFFSNLIPEGRLREVIEETARLEPGDDLALLAFVGGDLPGAVEVAPSADEEGLAPRGSGDAATEEEALSPDREALRFSLAGVQLKFSMLLAEEKVTLPARDQSGEWIVKFDTPTFPQLPENEISMLEWARAAGFDVPECSLLPVEAVEGFPRRFASPRTRVLAIRRYDRSPEGRIHQEDFAQVVGLPARKKYEHVTYEAMARLVRTLVDDEAVDELVRRLVFTVASGNGDAHLKNWSLVYPDRIRAEWSPLYDQVATVAWEAPARSLALKLAGVKAFGEIDRRSFERFADRAGIERPRVLQVIDSTLDRVRAVWRDHHGGWPLPPSHATALREHWSRVPLLRGAGALE